MTNTEIIMSECVLHDIPADVEVDTFAGWNRRGYRIIKGEHPCFSTKIWKPRPKKKKKDDEEETEQSRLILVMANFFTEEQVRKDGASV